jgi:arylsulfatase/uncharacterized sulfatase
MMVNAGMLEAMDHHIGRLVTWLESQGELDNTLFVITSDNGPEYNDIANVPGMGLWYAAQGYNKDIATMGEKGSLVSIGPEWASAAASPSKLFKFYSSDGGIRVPLILSGVSIPKATTQKSFSVVTDILPTVLDLVHLPLHNNPEDIAVTGRSLAPVILGTSEQTYGPDDSVGIETAGNAALFKGNYKLTRNLPPHGDRVWRLFDIVNDPGETLDLTTIEPDLFNELLTDYQSYAQTYGVQEMPQAYNSFKQVQTNTLQKLLKTYGLTLLAGGIVFLVLIILIIRKRWR